MRKYLALFIFFLVHQTFAQQKEIIAQGKVIDAITRKGVKARIFYKSIPTGSITGRFNDSTFSFPIFGSSKYQITADAEGYITGTAIVDPKDIDAANTVIRDISLTRKGESITATSHPRGPRDHCPFAERKTTEFRAGLPSGLATRYS